VILKNVTNGNPFASTANNEKVWLLRNFQSSNIFAQHQKKPWKDENPVFSTQSGKNAFKSLPCLHRRRIAITAFKSTERDTTYEHRGRPGSKQTWKSHTTEFETTQVSKSPGCSRSNLVRSQAGQRTKQHQDKCRKDFAFSAKINLPRKWFNLTSWAMSSVDDSCKKLLSFKQNSTITFLQLMFKSKWTVIDGHMKQ